MCDPKTIQKAILCEPQSTITKSYALRSILSDLLEMGRWVTRRLYTQAAFLAPPYSDLTRQANVIRSRAFRYRRMHQAVGFFRLQSTAPLVSRVHPNSRQPQPPQAGHPMPLRDTRSTCPSVSKTPYAASRQSHPQFLPQYS